MWHYIILYFCHSNKKYLISNTIVISTPVILCGNDTIISQGTFDANKGCFKITSSNVYFYGKFTLQLDGTKTTVSGEGTDNSGIKFYPEAPISDFYFEDITVKGFIVFNASKNTFISSKKIIT